MKIRDMVQAQIEESEATLVQARDRFQFLAGWNAACQQILTQLPAELELVPDGASKDGEAQSE